MKDFVFRYRYQLFSAFILFVLLINNNTPLWDQDEGAYAGFGKRILDTNNWLIPDYFWSNPHRKTPFHFWTIALSFKCFGISEFALRIPTFLFSAGTFLSLFVFIRKQQSEKHAFLTITILITSLLIPAISKIAVTDATLLFFMTICGIALWYVLYQKSWKHVFLFWISFALAVLTKGPPVLMFTGIFVFVLFVFSPSRKNLLRLHPWFFLPIALLPFTWWAYATYQLDQGAFLQFLLDHYIVKRINGSVFGQTGYPGTHVLFFIVAFIFWSPAFFASYKESVKSIRSKNKFSAFMFAWLVSGWLIYEFSPSKLPAYTLVSYVAIAYFISLGISYLLEKRPKLAKTLLIANCSFQFLVWSVGLALITPMKDVNKRVAAVIAKNTPKNSPVYIANKRFEPPSLPFYIDLQGMQVHLEGNMIELLRKYYYEKNSVLVLSKNQFDLLQSIDQSLKSQIVATPDLVGGVNNSYYLVFNKKTKLAPFDDYSTEAFNSYFKQILEDPVMIKSFVEKAKTNKVTLEQQIQSDMIWLKQEDSLKQEFQYLMKFGIQKTTNENHGKSTDELFQNLMENRFIE